MPCWFYEKPDLINTPSFKDSIDAATEARYRREGARFIIDAGTSQGLRYDTMATGVVYYHRFYMFHSFKEFPRFLTGAACLFLAGKVEETPKKCKDIIRMAKALVPDPHFATFGDDPKEEIMTYERILLQTIKFELQVSHPYSYLLKYAKSIKGDKNKIQKLVQMAWTFVNDSLCTTLCLQWEPHIVATAFLYLAGRLSKSDLLDWSGKSTKIKWWDQLTDDVSLDIMEDICHQLLDLYSSGQQKGGPIPGTPPKIGKKKAAKSSHPPSDSGKPASEEPREKVAKVEKTRDPTSKAAPTPAPAAQGAPPAAEYTTQPVQAPPPPPKIVAVEQPQSHPVPPVANYPSQPPRPAPPTAPPPQQVAPVAPQSSQYYQGTYAPAAPAVAVAGASAATTYASTAAPQQTYAPPTQPYQAPQAAVAPAPAPAAQPGYPAGQYGTAPAYGTQYYGQQSTYNPQYQQQPAQPAYPTSAPAAPPVTSQAPVQYGTQYTGQYGQAAPPAQPAQAPFDPSIPPPRMQAPPANVPPSMHAPPHQPPPTPPTHLPHQAHPIYPTAPHHPPPQTYAPQSNPTTPTVPPPQAQSYGYNAPPYQMQPPNVGVPRGPPPVPHQGQAPAPNISTGLATVRISSRESAWPGQHGGPSQDSQEWD